MSDQTRNADHDTNIWHGEQVWRWCCFYDWSLFWYSPELQHYTHKVDEKWAKTMPIRQIRMKIKKVTREVQKLISLVAPNDNQWQHASTPFLIKMMQHSRLKSKAIKVDECHTRQPCYIEAVYIDFNTPFQYCPLPVF